MTMAMKVRYTHCGLARLIPLILFARVYSRASLTSALDHLPLFLGYSAELCYTGVRGTFSSDGRPSCVSD